MFARTRSMLLLGVLAALATLGGCYHADEVNAFLCKPRNGVVASEYRCLPPDVLVFSSRRIVEIHGVEQQIRPDGKVNLPLVGEIDVSCRTPAEIEAVIRERAREYYEDADATVQIVGYNSQRYYVYGQVERPGPYPFTGHDTLLDALAQAQPTFLAWHKRIRLVRGSAPQEGGVPGVQTKQYYEEGIHPYDPEAPRHTMTFNLLAMVREGDLKNNVMLMPNDVIYVQAHPLAKAGLAIQSLLFPIRPMTEAARTPAAMSGGGL